MRWILFTVLGVTLLAFGTALLAYAPNIPVYYSGGGMSITFGGKVATETVPDFCEITVITIPNTLHINAQSEKPFTVEVLAPNKTAVARWQNLTVNEDLIMSECGLWYVNISEPVGAFVYGEVFTTAPLLAHPALIYASIPLLLGTMSILHSISKKDHSAYLQDILFEQNIGGRWVFLAWVPILITIADAPALIPSFPWLYALLIIITVIAVFSSFALAYVKIYLSTKGIYLEAPFLNLHKHYDPSQIHGYAITQENKQRLLGLQPIPSIRPKKEDQITIFILNPLPKRLWITSFGSRLRENSIIFRPKSLDEFFHAADRLGIVKKDAAGID